VMMMSWLVRRKARLANLHGDLGPVMHSVQRGLRENLPV
jgi:hypothetical protein